MMNFICPGTYVQVNTSKGPRIGIVETSNPKIKCATVKTVLGIHFRNYKDLIVISYKEVK